MLNIKYVKSSFFFFYSIKKSLLTEAQQLVTKAYKKDPRNSKDPRISDPFFFKVITKRYKEVSGKPTRRSSPELRNCGQCMQEKSSSINSSKPSVQVKTRRSRQLYLNYSSVR